MSQLPTWYYALQIGIPALLIVAGWSVVHSNAKKIEKRKEVRDFLSEIIGLIEKIESDINRYYSKSNDYHIGNDSNRIKANFLLLSRYLLILKEFGVTIESSDSLVGFRQAATGGFFETTDYMKQTTIPGWNAQISSSAARLKLSLRHAYFKWTTKKSRWFRQENSFL